LIIIPNGSIEKLFEEVLWASLIAVVLLLFVPFDGLNLDEESDNTQYDSTNYEITSTRYSESDEIASL